MIIGTVKFPGLVGNDKRKQNKYLSQLKKNAVILCKQYSRGSNRYIADLNKRLNLIKDYIKEQYNINISIYKIIEYAFANMSYDSSRKYLVIAPEIKIKDVPVELLIKLIEFGNLEVRGYPLFKTILMTAYKAAYCNLFILNWGVI